MTSMPSLRRRTGAWPQETDVSQLKGDVSQLNGDVSQLKGDVGELKGVTLESKLRANPSYYLHP